MKYISDDNSIILAVSSATEDLARSDSLKLAAEVDPEGLRTSGVITKLDRLEGKDFRNELEGKVIPLKKGFVGVVNRSLQDLKDRKPIEEHWKTEKEFFANEDSPYK